MKKFLVLYRAPVTAMQQMAQATPEQAKAGMDAWMAWAGRAGAHIVDLGMPATRVGSAGADAAPTEVAGYSLLQAATAADLHGLLEGHPHLHMPGGSIELLELLQLPGMG